jgi:NTP pyrophosphatase (non-canonical NTP hydrolase)
MKTTFFDYEKFVEQTKDNMCNDILYLTVAMCGEAGEVADKVKKIYRDHEGIVDSVAEQEIAAELGDVLWYLTAIAVKLRVPLWSIAKCNIDKVNRRINMETLHGSGDYR